MRQRRWAAFWLAGCAFTSACSENSVGPPLSAADDEAVVATSEALDPPEATTGADPGTGQTAEEPDPALRGELSMEIVAVHPHDPDAFTQGLEMTADGRLLESTGLYGESDRRIVDIETGAVALIRPLSSDLFGEGITIVGDELIQLTWKEGTYLRADLESLVEIERGTYEGEGWGLCHDGERLVMSDGTATLAFRDPDTFAAVGSIEVTVNDEPVSNLNELECVDGQVLANVWRSDTIVVIDPGTGEVVAWLDGAPLRPAGADGSRFLLNGIAHDPSTGHFFLTGKRWPVLYEVEIS